ncbi:hypothetical protein ABZ615_11125 [Streptomyces sp. NPDC007325]|uniref:hypothetical protein n=1 Tax=Streptomyces sp. NPDC007325 TaxID=3154588 RepID=UPI003405BEBC
MTSRYELRLLPWSGPDGKPCFLSTDDSNSLVSCLADDMEEAQLFVAAELVAHALETLAGEEVQLERLRCLATALTEALEDALRVAQSRGLRLP